MAATTALNLGAVYMLVQINEWNRLFYDALNKDWWRRSDAVRRFAVLAFIYIAIAIYRASISRSCSIALARLMTAQYATRWLSDHAFYRIELPRFTRADTDRPDDPGRPSPTTGPAHPGSDINLFNTQTVALSMGLLNAR